jgi:hypothetical protein
MTWDPVDSADDLARLLGFDRNQGAARISDVLSLLGEMPNAEGYIEARTVFPEPDPGTLSYMVPRTRFFFNVSKSRQLWGDAAVAAALYVMTADTILTFAVASIRKIVDNLILLSDDEAEVVHGIIHLSKGMPYDHGVEEAKLLASWTDATVSISGLLDSLEGKGVIAGRRTDRIVLVF